MHERNKRGQWIKRVKTGIKIGEERKNKAYKSTTDTEFCKKFK